MKQVHWTVTTLAAFAALTSALVAMPRIAGAQDQVYVIETIALSGDPAPGTGDSFGSLVGLDLNDSGTVAVLGTLGTTSSQGVWVGQPGNLALVARRGDLAPGSIETFQDFLEAHVNAAGEISILASLAVSGDGIWSGTPGNLALVAKTGDPATSEYDFETLGGLNLDDLGATSFIHSLSKSDGTISPNASIWTGTAGLLDLVARSGDLAPGGEGLAFLAFIDLLSRRSGTLGFIGELDGPDFTFPQGIWVDRPEGLSLVAKAGDPAPGSLGRSFVFFHPPFTNAGTGGSEPGQRYGPVMNSAGAIAFRGFVDPIDPADPFEDGGIWIDNAGSLTLAVLHGDPAPGTAGQLFSSFNLVSFNALGQIAFFGYLDTLDFTNNQGIWLGQPGSLSLVARTGDPAPGTGGETFSRLVHGPSLNSSGEVAFFGRLLESGGQGIWAGTAGNLSLVARDGKTVQVRPGDSRRIHSISPIAGSGSEIARPSLFNDAGQVIFTASFADGTQGLFLGTPIDAASNQPPVADAGPDQSVFSTDTITLDATGSFDPEGLALSYVWTLGGDQIATGPVPTVGPFAVGTHTIVLTVTDSFGVSASDSMIANVVNRSPIAHAGPDRTVNHATIVNLDGSGSHDPDGDPLTYVWSLDGAQIAAGPIASVGPFDVGTYSIVLTVTDTFGANASDSMTLTVINEPPVADAGADRTIRTLETVTLDGTGSSDPEGTALTYTWSLGGSQIATGPMPTAGPFDDGSHTITLTVTDAQGASASDSLVLTVLNRPPVADAGADRTIRTLETVTLDGTGSSDPEGTALSYTWSLGGSQIATGPTPTVGPFDDGSHTITLTVTDAQGASASDSLVLTVLNRPPVADAGADLTVTLRGRTAQFTLDGSASTDPDGSILSYLWTEGGALVANGPSALLERGEGVYNFTLTVTDDDGATASDDVVVTVSRGRQASGL